MDELLSFDFRLRLSIDFTVTFVCSFSLPFASAWDRVFFGDMQAIFFSFCEYDSVVCFLRVDDAEGSLSAAGFVSDFDFALLDEDDAGVAISWFLVADPLRRRFDSEFSLLARKWAICFGGAVADVGLWLTFAAVCRLYTLLDGKRNFGILLYSLLQLFYNNLI